MRSDAGRPIRRDRWRRAPLLASVFWLGLVRVGKAQTFSAEGSDRVALEYRAPTDCPAQTSFESRGRDALARLDARDRLSVELSTSERGFRGEMELVAADAIAWARTIDGMDCDDLVSALALSLSIHLDESSEDSGLPAPQPPAPAVAPAGDARDDALTSPSAVASRSIWHFALDAGAGVRSGLGEFLDPSMRGGLEASFVGNVPRSYRLGFELGEGAVRRLPAGLGDGRWDHRWWTANLQACPWGHALTRSVDLQPCLSVHFGRYSAELDNGATRASWLGFAELAARFRARLGRWASGFELGAFVPFDPLDVERQGQIIFSQTVGLSAAVAFAYAPIELHGE